MMNKHCEISLPEGYKEVFHIDARNKKTGIIFNTLSLIPLLIMFLIFALTVKDFSFLTSARNSTEDFFLFLARLAGLFIGIFAYIVLHELTHGVAYKALTKEKLTFGMSWSCAFCGVPNIYVYRKTAIIALMAPFVTFTLILLPLTIIFAFVDTYFYLLFGFLFAMHFGGCCGDLYMFFLLTFKYKDKTLLMRDTGPEQWIYIKQ